MDVPFKICSPDTCMEFMGYRICKKNVFSSEYMIKPFI